MLLILRSIRARLTFWYTLLVLSTLVGFGAAAYYYTGNTLSDNLDISLRNEVGWVRDFIQPQASKVKPGKLSIDALLRKPPPQRRAQADTLSADSTAEEADEIWNQILQHTLLSPKKTYIQVADRKGTIIYRSYSLGLDSLVIPDTVAVNETILTTSDLNDQAVRCAVTRDRNFTIVVGYPLDGLREALDNLFSIFLILIPIAVAVSITGGLYLAHQSLRPVHAVTTHARRITAENLDQTITVRNPRDEIGQLAATINEMILRLRDSFARIRQFSADASHELRTPLTIMRGEIELALRTPHSDQAYRRVLASTLEEILRLTSITDNLLFLAKADRGLHEFHMDRVDLGSLTDELYEDSRVLASPKNISITLTNAERVTIVGDRIRLRQLFLNLIDNAIKYTPEGGSVSFGVARKNGTALFEVSDTGVGIPQEELGKVFDRFYRVDKARSREMGGSGLGLSIARWIAELHRGSIVVHSEINKGSTFTVQLPITEQ